MKKTLQGRVVSTQMQKTIRVQVARRFLHPIYKKTVMRSKDYLTHDEEAKAGVGDLVEIVETRPLSKCKRWRLMRILEKAR
ncbi:MAG: 30S ribosomal protein S17 [Candidatus Lindowbacteria bacterium RIFCSPLOWO2_12_FULL_62_27]|nr:ribosomal protein S17 [uncultured bacterium]OGH59718.1 MAG: 30S ribosomal protein S17 [Candidatus Lindowbacteria bacterium RIFCSPLOWO2_12_FULL_62_27]